MIALCAVMNFAVHLPDYSETIRHSLHLFRLFINLKLRLEWVFSGVTLLS